MAEDLGYLYGISGIEASRANVFLLQQDWKAAQQASTRALHSARSIGHRNSESFALENMGLALGGVGLAEEALASLEQAIQIAISISDPSRRDSARLSYAWVALQNGMTERCRLAVSELPSDISPELAPWKRTMEQTLETLDTGNASALHASIEREEKSSTTEDHLRRLDAAILLAERAGDIAANEELVARRKEVFKDS